MNMNQDRAKNQLAALLEQEELSESFIVKCWALTLKAGLANDQNRKFIDLSLNHFHMGNLAKSASSFKEFKNLVLKSLPEYRN